MSREAAMTTNDIVQRIDALDGQEPEGQHYEADELLLEAVDPAVKAAYLRLTKRARWWAHA